MRGVLRTVAVVADLAGLEHLRASRMQVDVDSGVVGARHGTICGSWLMRVHLDHLLQPGLGVGRWLTHL